MKDVARNQAGPGLPGKNLFLGLLLLNLVLIGCGGSQGSSGVVGRQEAIREAQTLYHKAKARGVSFANGPCISNGKDIGGWVVDIAHRPRQPVDDLPQNQCSAFVDGKVDHFVELDPRGRLIRTGP